MSASSTLLQYAATTQNTFQQHSSPSVVSSALHQLCTNCTQFSRQWRLLDDVQQPDPQLTSAWPILQLCTVAHLVVHQTSCHLCKFLLASSLSSYKYDLVRLNSSKVYLQPQSKEDAEDQVVYARVWDETLPEGKELTFFTAFLLRRYHYSDVGGFHQHITAKAVPLLAQDNLERAKTWIHTCSSEHERCRAFHHNTVQQNNRRPTRVLEVSDTSVKVRCNMMNQNFEYLALSHIWGDPSAEHLKLKHKDIDHFQAEVPWHRLSPVYKEAIRVTLALGYKYLWIDSLCIIQDSEADWKYEAALMSTVYGNAACSLAFIFPFISAETSTRPDPRASNPCILRPATSHQPGVYVQHNTSLLRAAYQTTEPQDWLIQRNWPLFNRAWTFQEYLLSPRTLLLGHRNLMWQCSAGFYDELLGPVAEAAREFNNITPKRGRDMGKSRYFPHYLGPGFGSTVIMTSPKSLSFMLDWQALINDYRSRHLSFPKDRIIAFAGIARAFQTLGSLTYLAGVWKEFFPLGLLWYLDKKSEATVRYSGPSVRRGGTVEYPVQVHEEVVQAAPSWSQFSVPIYTHHQTYFMFNDDEVFIRSKSFEEPPRLCWDDIYWIAFRSYRFGEGAEDYSPETGFFDFTDLEVTLDIPVLPVRISWPIDLAEHFKRIRATDPQDARLLWIPDFTYYPDRPGKSTSPPRHSVLALVAEYQTCRIAGKYNIQRRLAGLVLIRGEREGYWNRVGAWKLKIKICDVEVNEQNMKEVAKRWKRYRTWTMGETWKREKVTLI